MEPTLHGNFQQDSGGHYGPSAGSECRSGGLLRQESVGGASRRLRFRPVRGESCNGGGGRGESHTAEYWKIGTSGHRIHADELATVQWLLQEVKTTF